MVLSFGKVSFNEKSVHLAAIFAMPLGSYFRHPIYLNEGILKSKKLPHLNNIFQIRNNILRGL